MTLRGPRAQWLVASVLVPAFTLAAGTAFWLQARGHAELESSFQRELGLLVQLPRLREDVRRLDEATNQYLQGGDRRQLRAQYLGVRMLKQAVDHACVIEPVLDDGLDELEKLFAGHKSSSIGSDWWNDL